MGNAMLAQLKCSESCPLVTRPGLVHPQMEGYTLVVCQVDGCRGCSVIDTGQPPGVAMGENIDGPAGFFVHLSDQGESVFPYPAAVFPFLFQQIKRGVQTLFHGFHAEGCRIGYLNNLLECCNQVYCRGACGTDLFCCLINLLLPGPGTCMQG